MARVDLSDYGYVNARVRGMRAHLLKKGFFMRLVEAEDFETIHNMMEQTVYRREMNEALLLKPERPDYDQALNLNLIAALRKIHDATGGEARRLVTMLLSKYDRHILKAFIRGKQGNATPGEIMSLLIPLGSLRMDVLEDMAREREIQDVIATMQAHGIKYGKVLAKALPDYLERERDLAVLELALDKAHYRESMLKLKGRDPNVEMVRQMFSAQIDIRNISTLVRIRGLKLEDEEVENLRIPLGSLTAEQFLELYKLGDIASIVSEYPDVRYRRLLERALAEYQELDVVAFDRELERELIRLGAGMSNVDVLGIGVIIGFMVLKENELVNLRVVLKGKEIERSSADIRKDLFFIEREGAEVA